MFTPINTLSDQARVWIYPSSRKFYAEEITSLTNKLQDFVTFWNSDIANFKASFELKYDRFIIFYVDDDVSVSLADINQQIAFVLELEQQYSITLLDKMNVCFKQGKYIQYKELKDFKKLIKDRAVTAKTIVFDNLVNTKFDLENYWETPLSESWYNRFL
ncbi:ABC transporter ATPase [Tenacibaculum sp. UWU-22]|uniref:ABC transporter ATPase n=1 Tax=Tenacibaculum sp. UWU-22 TaxID=3234187 RepID=UPI0034DB35E8